MFGDFTFLAYSIRQFVSPAGSKGEFMKAKRTALLGMLVCLTSVAASAQIAASNQGDIGLFTMPTADNPRAGQFTLGLYGWKEQLVAGSLPGGDDWQSRLYKHYAGAASIGLGLSNHWSIFASAGTERRESRGGWQGGVVNGIPTVADFEVDEGRKIRIGTKVNFISEADADFRIGLWLAAHAPVSDATIRQDEQGLVTDAFNSRRADWEWGAVATKGIFSGMASYVLAGRHDQDIRPSNLLRLGFGVDVPILPILHVIGELDRTITDGGDFPEEDYSMAVAGVRFWFGHTGWAVSGALNTNLDMLFRDGFSPSPVGGLIGLTYAAWPPPPPPPVVVPEPAPAVEESTETTTTVETTPPPSPPPPPAPRKTTDEIFFDGGSARLTNIAKAVLDGVALRMRNDLNSTAVIAGYSDATGSEEQNLAISARRADAAKEYLVTRHGIDPNRITTEAKGSAEPAYDNSTAEGRAKNRRALIVVTLVSGT
jgi:outer membrane protein OmpA-like peptidoglycan-associated protein